MERTEADDQALVVRVARGDRGAFEELYAAHAGWLTARLHRRCGEPDIVDIALQDTFLAVWKGAKRYKRTGDVGAWIWGIAIRKLIDQLRERRPVPVDDPWAGGVGGATISTEDHVFDVGIHGELAEAFRHLDADLQSVLVATAIDGLSTREAGALLGVPQGTVKTRLMRARAQLREQLT